MIEKVKYFFIKKPKDENTVRSVCKETMKPFLTITGMTGHIEWGQRPGKKLNGYSC